MDIEGTNNSSKERFVECLTQQLSELELLESMYPNKGDLILCNKNIKDIKSFIENNSEYVPDNLDFTLNLFNNQFKIEISINLPSFYPEEGPDVYIRCNQLNRMQETLINSQLQEFMKTINRGELCLYTIITWIQEHIEDIKLSEVLPAEETSTSKLFEEKFSRLWVYSHHIYNKKKREKIVKKAKELNLTGFCLPGKPGIVCIEGETKDCEDWWREIKCLNWQKLVIQKSEVLECLENDRKFTNFEELQFQSNNNTKFSNMSEFSKFMNLNGFQSIFNELFGL